jgi:hypothetical protein
MKSILDPSFRYTASFNTDLRKTFARIVRAHRMVAQSAAPAPVDAVAKVTSLVRKTVTNR